MTTQTISHIKKHPRFKKRSLIRYLFKANRNQPNLLHHLAKEYGDFIHFQFGPRHVFFVTSLKGVEHILQNNQHNYRGFNYSHVKLRPLLGNGLLTSEGDLWLKHRRLAQQAFHKEQLVKLSKLMVTTMTHFLDGWDQRVRAQSVQDVGAEMGLFTLEVVSQALFGAKIGDRAARVRDAWPQVMEHMVRRLVNPLRLPEQLPVFWNRPYKKSLGLLNDTIYSLISEHRANSQDDGNLLGMLIAAHDGELDDIHLDDQELRDEVMTILLAGHETCANALTWTLYLLARHPEIQERLADEASEALHGREPDYEDLPRLPYAGMVFQEALRLYPPAWIMARDAVHDDVIEGRSVPAGSLVFLSPYVTHRNPEFWDEPLRFDPLRFSAENSTERPRFAYFPFGGGQRQCLGKNFALVEAQLAIPMIIQRYRFSLQDPSDPDALQRPPVPSYSMRPEQIIRLKIEKR
jgi:cytochrome P450